MVPSSERNARGKSLPMRLAVAMLAAALFVAVVLGFLGADRTYRLDTEAAAEADRSLATALSERASPLLEREDLMRLSVLATVARDQTQGRVLVLDRFGKVAIDTALVLGDRQMGLLSSGAPFQRISPREDGALLRETIAPVRFGGDLIGELRLRREVAAQLATFDFGWFGLVLLCCISLVAVAVILGHQWSSRVRAATDTLIRLTAGEFGGAAPDATSSELQDLRLALQEMERGVQTGLQQVAEGYVAMAMTVVEGLERRRLIVPGHGERTAKLAMRVADRLQLVAADRNDLELACRLNELGKAWVRTAILQKQGPLTDVEKESLRQHPLRAAEHLECLPSLRRVARLVRHQAERYDGLGLPDRLRGDRIPLGARVMALAAAFDTLTNTGDDRLSCQGAIERLREARGEVFDPWLCDVFAEELERDPPAVREERADREVSIVPNGTLMWPMDGMVEEEDLDDDADEQELEVMLDETDAGDEAEA